MEAGRASKESSNETEVLKSDKSDQSCESSKVRHTENPCDIDLSQCPNTDYGEAQAYVENVMSQPACTSVTTPISNRRKRFLSAPSADSTIKRERISIVLIVITTLMMKI